MDASWAKLVMDRDQDPLFVAVMDLIFEKYISEERHSRHNNGAYIRFMVYGATLATAIQLIRAVIEQPSQSDHKKDKPLVKLGLNKSQDKAPKWWKFW